MLTDGAREVGKSRQGVAHLYGFICLVAPGGNEKELGHSNDDVVVGLVLTSK